MRRLYLHLPRFPVQCAVRDLPELRHAPLILAEESRGQQRVAFASSAALKAGIRPGMGVTAARAVLPAVGVRRFDAEGSARALRSLGETLLALGPAFEVLPPDGLFLDASAAPLCRGPGAPEQNLLERVLALCAEWGLLGQGVVASHAFTARALARHRPVRLQCVAPDGGAAALAALPLQVLEEAAALRAVAALSALGLSTLGEVAALPTASVVARLGAEGLRAQGLCRGEDPTPLHPDQPEETVEERVELETPAEQLEPLLFALKSALDRCAARLQGRGLSAVRLLLTLRLGNGAQHPVPLQLARPSAQARPWLELFRHLLAALHLPHPVAGLEVRVAEAQAAVHPQGELGDGPQGDAPLESVLSRLATALGEEALLSASPQPRHRPEAAVRPARFQPPRQPRGMISELLPAASRVPAPSSPPSPALREEGAASLPPGWSGFEQGLGVPLPAPGWLEGLPVAEESAPEQRALSAQSERPARLLPTPQLLEVVLGGAGLPALLRVAGRMRRVLALFGPERLSGEWWEPDPLERDYYRGQLEGLGLVWLYRDGRDGRFYLHGLFD
jgi:protein ImuB